MVPVDRTTGRGCEDQVSLAAGPLTVGAVLAARPNILDPAHLPYVYLRAKDAPARSASV